MSSVYFGCIWQLVKLDLHQNNLTGLVPGSWGTMSALGTIDLSDNPLNSSVDLSLASLAPSKQLATVKMRNCNLAGYLPEQVGLCSVPRTHLSVSRCRVVTGTLRVG